MAALLKGLGYDLGDDHDIPNDRNREANKQVRGNEHMSLKKLLDSWHNRFPNIALIDDPKLADHQGSWADTVRDEAAMVSRDLPDVVKCPVFNTTLSLWLNAGGKRPNHVIVCMRNTLDVAVSNKRDMLRNESRDWLASLNGFLFEQLVANNIPFSTVWFPSSVQNPDHVYAHVPLMKQFTWEHYRKVWGSVADPDSIKTTEAEREAYRITQGELTQMPDRDATPWTELMRKEELLEVK
jgi:hypothetical protein